MLPHHVKRTRAKGRVYLYFRTGQRDAKGREILIKLPTERDPGFGSAYASCLAARSRRNNKSTELTVPALCDLYERSEHFRGLSAGSQRIYGSSLAYLKRMLPTAPAGQLERKDVVRLIDGRADTPGAANSLLKSIGALYKWARLRGHVDNNPCRDIAELAVGEHEPWPDHVLDAALKTEAARVRLAVHLLLYTAQRIGDVVEMKWTDVSIGEGGTQCLAVRQQKTGRQMVIPLHDALKQELARHERSLGYIIKGVRGQALSQKALRTELQQFAAKLGAKIVPHGLRKNAVNALLEAGCSAAETAAISGQTLQMVEHYAKARSQQKLGETAILKWQSRAR